MLTIDLGQIELFDTKSMQFVYRTGGVVQFEYTLKTIYDWEYKWRKPFLKGGLTDEETMDFYLTMANRPVDPEFITEDVQRKLNKLITDNATATTFSTASNRQNGNKANRGGKVLTAEEIYAMMFMANIPLEFENRNLNRLLTVLRIMNAYNSETEKMNQEDILLQNRELNELRKKQLKTKG